MYRIYIIEDDSIIAGAIKKGLEAWAFEVRCAEDFSNIMSEFSSFAPHLVLLDVSLPFFNGYHWCREIRSASDVPVIFISSAADNMNMVMAMNMGADDFIAKPFDLIVLTAKVQAVLRRTYDYRGHESRITEHAGAIFNPDDYSVSYNGQRAELTKNENRIMQTLLGSKHEVVSREKLMNELWACDSFVDENTLSVNITRLRRKLESIGLVDFIVTKKGAGYMVK